MPQRWFELDGELFVPEAYRAWRAAREKAQALFSALPEPCPPELEAAAIAANLEAQRLEELAYEAFDAYVSHHYGRSSA